MAGEGTYVGVVLEGNINLNVFYKVVSQSHAPTLLCCWREIEQTLDILCVNEAARQCLTKYHLNLHDFKQILYDSAFNCSADIKRNEVKWQQTFTASDEVFSVEANIIFRSEEETYFLLYLEEEKIEEKEIEEIEVEKTDGRKTEDEERETGDASKLSIHNVLNETEDAVFLLDQSGCFIDMNKKAETLSGLNGDDFKGVHYEELLLQEDRLDVAKHFQKAFAGEVQVYDVTLNRKQGLIVLTVINIPHIVSGKIRGVYGVAKPKRLPCNWNNLASIIEDKYKVIVENSYDIICLTDKEGHYLLASHSYLPVLGYEPLKLTGQSVLSYIHPNDHKRVQETLIKMVQTKEESEAVVYRKMHANGQYKYFEGKGMPILSSSGEVVSFVVISRDITDMKNRDDLLIRSEKLALAGELAAGIAHEIKNPLTTLKGFFQLTESQLEPYRDVLMHELNQINDIIEELLLVARPRAIKEEEVDLLNVIRESLTSIDTEIQLKNITLDLQLCDEAYLLCAPHQLTQVFINLLKNAVEAMDNEGNLSINVKKVNQTIHIIVKDTGIGMTQEDLARLGEPYYSISSKGTGIGLMVCYKVIENHGGSMSITSVCEVGTEVSIQLPGLQTMSLK